MNSNDTAKKVLNTAYGDRKDSMKGLSPYEVAQKQAAAVREHDRKFQAEMRERIQRTIDNHAEQEARQASEREATNEAAFRADELQKYLAAGGTQAQFDTDWPRLRQQLVEQRFFGNTVRPKSETDPVAVAKRRLDLLYKRR